MMAPFSIEGASSKSGAIHQENGEPNYVLLALQGTDVEALKYDGDRYSISTSIPLASIDPAKLLVTHFYGLDEVRYEGVGALARGLWTKWPYAFFHLRRLRNSIAQRLFNRQTLEVRRRLDILRDVVDATMGGADAVDALDLMSVRYGYRWAGHPGWESHHRLLKRHLDLLVQSGELENWEQRYRPTGMALKTLDESEDEDRKHSANLRVQWLLAALTLLSALMAAAQANLLKLPTLLDLSAKTTTAATASAGCGCVAAETTTTAKVTPAPVTQKAVDTVSSALGASQSAKAPRPKP